MNCLCAKSGRSALDGWRRVNSKQQHRGMHRSKEAGPTGVCKHCSLNSIFPVRPVMLATLMEKTVCFYGKLQLRLPPFEGLSCFTKILKMVMLASTNTKPLLLLIDSMPVLRLPVSYNGTFFKGLNKSQICQASIIR